MSLQSPYSLQIYTWETWLLQNDLMHCKAETKLLAICTELNATIKHYLTCDLDLLSTESHLLSWDLPQLLLQSRPNKQHWLYQIKQAQARATKLGKSQTLLAAHHFKAPSGLNGRKQRPKYQKPAQIYSQKHFSAFLSHPETITRPRQCTTTTTSRTKVSPNLPNISPHWTFLHTAYCCWTSDRQAGDNLKDYNHKVPGSANSWVAKYEYTWSPTIKTRTDCSS